MTEQLEAKLTEAAKAAGYRASFTKWGKRDFWEITLTNDSGKLQSYRETADSRPYPEVLQLATQWCENRKRKPATELIREHLNEIVETLSEGEPAYTDIRTYTTFYEYNPLFSAVVGLINREVRPLALELLAVEEPDPATVTDRVRELASEVLANFEERAKTFASA